jgi:hypothetical protein
MAIAVVGGTLLAVLSQLTIPRQAKIATEELVSGVLTRELQAIDERVKDLEAARLASRGGDRPTDLRALEHRINEMEETTLGLRQAMNPMAPDELLTIARLGDEVRSLRADYVKLEEALVQDLGSFQQSVQRELQSANSSANLILVVLVPLAFNFLYTIWKDMRSMDGRSGRSKK